MKQFSHEFAVRAKIDAVWNFFTDLQHFAQISPASLNEMLLSSSTSRMAQGTELKISTDLFMRRIWRARITSFRRPVEYVDQVEGGIFAKWVHTHSFKVIDKERTLIKDHILFSCKYGILGAVLERLIFSKLGDIFEQREQRARAILEGK